MSGHLSPGDQNDTSALLEKVTSNALAMATVFEHVSHFPPHGPFAHLTSVSLASVLERLHELKVPTQVLTQLLIDHFRIDHLREWPSLYVAAELRLSDVDDL